MSSNFSVVDPELVKSIIKSLNGVRVDYVGWFGEEGSACAQLVEVFKDNYYKILYNLFFKISYIF